MKRIVFLGAALWGLFSLSGPASAGENQEESATAPKTQRYRYEAMPAGGQADQKEFIVIEFQDRDYQVEYISRAISPEGTEEITIYTDPQGKFISGTRSMADPLGKRVRQERVWRTDHKAYLEASTGKDETEKEYELAQGSVLAVDGSLLVLLRSFPFHEGKEWDIFMIDFSGYSITVTVRMGGMETIFVPAGEFECYRMEVVVHIPILRPKIIYWLSKMKPHFLVKHQGKRGPFTSTYLTSLLTFE
jgi:hypothetical protein